MMEQVYALEVTVIECIQYWFQDWADYFKWVNDLSNPHTLLEFLFPLVSIVDSVFAAQILLVLSFGGWLNTVMKWWLLEDRPYWWVQETSFYTSQRPRLKQTQQTCETGPGSPSGHSASGAAGLMLLLMVVSHVMRDRKFYLRYWKYVLYPLCGAAIGSIFLARVFVAAHFPHQCLFGALVGAFLAPALCIYVSDPWIWRAHADARAGMLWHAAAALLAAAIAALTYAALKLLGIDPQWTVKLTTPGASLAWALCIYVSDPWIWRAHADARAGMLWHAAAALLAAAIAALTYAALKLQGIDPQWTVKLAFRWCENPEDIKVSSTPLYSLMQCTACLLGWALSVTPVVAEYRHYTANRSLIISSFATGMVMYACHEITARIDKTNTLRFYASHFALNVIKPALLLRLSPALAMLPFCRKEKVA